MHPGNPKVSFKYKAGNLRPSYLLLCFELTFRFYGHLLFPHPILLLRPPVPHIRSRGQIKFQSPTGRSAGGNQRILRKIRKAFGKPKTGMVSRTEFCIYCCLDEEEVKNICGLAVSFSTGAGAATFNINRRYLSLINSHITYPGFIRLWYPVRFFSLPY